MKYINIFTIFLILMSCKKEVAVVEKIESKQPVVTTPINIVYSVQSLDSLSDVNKNSSWYQTNNSFNELLDITKTPFNGLNNNSGTFTTYVNNPITVADYWNDHGIYFYYDFNKDGFKDVWCYNFKSPWPSNQKGLSIFSEYVKNTNSFNVELSLTSVRKAVISDLDNDGFKDIVMFSQGYDAPPFPGDSIGIFYPKDNKYQYLSDDIGFFHGGAVGDIDNDGLSDIVSFGLPNDMNNTPTVYLNKGNRKFSKSNINYKNFPTNGGGGYPTIELFDVDNNGFLDMVLGQSNEIKIIKNTNGIFDMNNIIKIQTNGLPLSFIFYDFNKDGKVDILTTNTYDYQGYNLNLYCSVDNNFKDESSNYFDVISYKSRNTWIKLLRLFDIDRDGDLDVVGDGLFGDLEKGKIHWKNDEGKFKQIIN